jgi:hypothetical protein
MFRASLPATLPAGSTSGPYWAFVPSVRFLNVKKDASSSRVHAPRIDRQPSRPLPPARQKARAPAAAAQASAVVEADQLPGAVRDVSAVLRTPNGSTVYVLGVSHVSKASCAHVRQLIAAVSPDIVFLELCKDRVNLLVDPAELQPSMWQPVGRGATVTGVPTGPGWPTATALAARLRTARGMPVSAAEIEDDAEALLATGGLRCRASQKDDASCFQCNVGTSEQRLLSGEN